MIYKRCWLFSFTQLYFTIQWYSKKYIKIITINEQTKRKKHKYISFMLPCELLRKEMANFSVNL